MPCMAGGSCLHILKAAHPDGFEETVIATVLREVLKGLEYLHHHGFIHRDVKAGNILIDARGGIKLGDFGVSAYLFDSGDRQRMRNTFVGTPCWMAPEVMEQLHGYDFKADIWSFGITALELAHGHAPFSKYPPMKVLLMTLQNAPPGLDYERDKKFSKSFKQMIASCLVKDPSKRPSAKKLLKHPFFKQARSNDYIARTLLEGLPALGDRMKALKRKEEDMLAQKKIPDGQKEEISQGIAKLQPFGRASCIYLGDEGSANIHPNLVNLHGCCIEGTELLLVYEYLENNSLARALFNSEKIQLILDWPTRVKICVGITKGLAYLHEESSLRIVHRDIKATNVLLDRDLNPKISDFRLARFTGDDNTHISTRVAGTIGYMAPEYALWGYLTYKADVYSFGIEKARGVISSPSHHPNTSINKPSVVTPIVPPPTTANADDVDLLVSDDDRSPSPIH